MRKKVWKRVSALAAAVCFMLCMTSAGVYAQENTWQTYVALGDSIASGYGLGEGESSFPALTASACALTLDNQAKAGATSADLLADLAGGSLNVADADVISVTVGGNDLMGALYSYLAINAFGGTMTAAEVQQALTEGNVMVLAAAVNALGGFSASTEAQTALENYGINLAGIITAIRGVNQKAAVVVVNQYNPYAYMAGNAAAADAGALSEAFDAGVRALNAVTAQVVGQSGAAGCFVADAYSAIAGATANPCNAYFNNFMDINLDFHPNAHGHELIAASVTSVIEGVKQASSALEAQAGAIRAVTALSSVDQRDAETAEAARIWAENLITPVIAQGVTADIQIVNFQAAQAGTAQNAGGTNGSFQISVTLGYAGYPIGNVVMIDTQIRASAYRGGQPSQENAGGSAPAAGTPAASGNQTGAQNQAVKAPVTGDTSDTVLYLVLLFAAGTAIAAIAARKRMEGR